MDKSKIKKQIKRIIKSVFTIRLLFGIIVGGIAGYVYYYFIGCDSGGCAITSNPVNSILYGSLFGAVLFFDGKEKKE